MQFLFFPMNETSAGEIVEHWHYDGAYTFYDMDADEDDLAIFMDRDYWKEATCEVVNEAGELVGWATFYTAEDGFWLSLGLRPDLTGQGLGLGFVNACVAYAVEHYAINGDRIKLGVAEFNTRAVKVYQRAGFTESGREVRETHIGRLPFILMEKPVAKKQG